MLSGLTSRFLLWPLLAVLLAGSSASASSRPKPARLVSEDALSTATRDWRQLSGNHRRRQQRKAWVRVVAGLEKVGRDASGPTSALALLRAGRAAEELSRVSGRKADSERAVQLYLDSAAALPSGSLADDALVDAARLERDVLKDAARARRTLDRAAALRGDRRADAMRLLSELGPGKAAAKETKPEAASKALTPSPKAVAAAREDFEKASAELKALQAAPARAQRREAWAALAQRFETAGAVLAPEADGALAYFRAGRAAEAVARQTNRPADASRAVALYEAVGEKCPGTSYADDALVAAAALETRLLSDPAAARRHLEEAIALNGDLAVVARSRARALDDIRAKDAPAVAAAEPKAEPGTPEAAETENVPAPPVPTEPAPETAAVAAGVRQLQKKALADTEWSLAEQVGLKIRRIVIDAGHGGHDTGAIGPTGVYEKDVTLAVAKELAGTLRNRGYDVVLTRDSDVFLALEERTQLANRERGDLFISVHANAHKSRQQSGVETYSLNVASDRYAMRLAARENATTDRPGSDLPFLLADLATRANTVDSARLAQEVQQSIVSGVARKFGKPKDHGVKHALFYVLLGARMPAVLVETAFLSNPGEEKKLSSAGYQAALGRAIADGVDHFVARRQQLASIEK